MRAYPRYRDSGVEWLGEVPDHWGIVRLKSMIQSFVGGSWGSEAGEDDEDAQCIRATDFDYRRLVAELDSAPVRSFPRRDVLRRGLHRGELVMATSAGSTDRAVGAVVVFDGDQPALPTNFAAKMVPGDDVDTWYLAYLHNALNTMGVTRSLTNQVTIANLDTPAYLSSHGPLPPLDEQRAIAAFLDRETERIDALVAKKRLLIERLEEYRTALITRTVTRGLPPEAARAAGLDPSPSLKPSGVEWLGDAPEHWEVLKPSVGFDRIGSGTTPRSDAEEYYDGDTPWVTTSELREDTILETAKSVAAAALREHTALHVYAAGALVIAMYGATIGRLGILGVPATVNQACCVFAQPTRLRTRFVYYWLLGFRDVLISHSAGGGQPNLSQEALRALRIPAPPTLEQDRIGDYLDTEVARLDGLASEIESAIERLQEYRTALITAAVTGKIDVRE